MTLYATQPGHGWVRRLFTRPPAEPNPLAWSAPLTLADLTPADLGVWVTIHATEQIMLGELGNRQRDYDGFLLELAARDGRTWVKLRRFRGEADDDVITRSFRSDTPIEVRR